MFKRPEFYKDLIRHILLLGFYYAAIFIFIPNFYYKKKYVTFGLEVILCYLAICFIPVLLFRPVMPPPPIPIQIPPGAPAPPFPFFPQPHFIIKPNAILFRPFFQFISVLTLAFLIKFRDRWKQSENEKKNAELSLLKAQINPHFLFNTLNSLYSLAIIKSEQTADGIAKLSGMMRYMLHDSALDLVPLRDEINYIKNYTELQRLRIPAEATIKINIQNEAGNKKIAPMVLIPFIENAFKYGVNPDEEIVIEINITANSNAVEMTCKNRIVNLQTDEYMQSGVGLENAKKRMLLIYPRQHILKIEKDEEWYHVFLSVTLND